MKVYSYYFRSDSGDSYMEMECSDKPLDVYEAMKKFDWDDYNGWIEEGYEPEEIPYDEFITMELDTDTGDTLRSDYE